ncbi:MAG TPA: hypothetical protein VJ302_27655 [Blastocatellia bacterium]|nr:hypothetical protein [Blastocatellia bacterium]
MADNVAITAGSGTNIATDDVGGVHFQRVKLVDGTLDGTGAIGGDGTNGLDVDPTRLPAGENFLGFAGSKQVTVSASKTRPADTTAYAVGDAITESTSSPTVMTFSGVARANGGSGIIIGALLIDSANQTTKGQFELLLYDTTFTPDNDNAANTPTDAEMETLIGTIQFNLSSVGDATSGAGGNCAFPVGNLSIPFTCGGGSTSIFGQLVARNAYTPVSGEKFTVRLQIIQN